jgi:hypothetical protein
MAPNGRSNIHADAYMTDTYRGAGPLGKRITRTSTLLAHECAPVTFDVKDRIVANLRRPRRPDPRDAGSEDARVAGGDAAAAAPGRVGRGL